MRPTRNYQRGDRVVANGQLGNVIFRPGDVAFRRPDGTIAALNRFFVQLDDGTKVLVFFVD
jgi:hypothetical protein